MILYWNNYYCFKGLYLVPFLIYPLFCSFLVRRVIHYSRGWLLTLCIGRWRLGKVQCERTITNLVPCFERSPFLQFLFRKLLLIYSRDWLEILNIDRWRTGKVQWQRLLTLPNSILIMFIFLWNKNFVPNISWNL